MPKCPKCGSTNLKPDPKNPGKVLCYGCRSRIPEEALVADDPQPQATPQQTGGFARQTGGFSAADSAQPMGYSSPQPSQSGSFGQDAFQQGGQQFQQPQLSQSGSFGQPQPSQSGSFGQPQPSQSGSFGQPQPSQSGSFGQSQPSQSGSFGQSQASQQGAFGQPQASQQGAFGQGGQQFQQPQGAPQAGGFAQGMNDFGQQAQAMVNANGGTQGLFSNLFVMPDGGKLNQAAMSGFAMNWYKAIVMVLAFLGVIGGVISGLQQLIYAINALGYGFSIGYVLAQLFSAVVTLAPVPFLLVIRKRMALFTKGSWAEVVALYAIEAVLTLISGVLTLILAGGFGNIAILLLTLVVCLAISYANYVYFAKRDWLFDYENVVMGCAPSKIAGPISSVFGKFAQPTSPMQQGMMTQAPPSSNAQFADQFSGSVGYGQPQQQQQQWGQQPQQQPQQQWGQQPQQQWDQQSQQPWGQPQQQDWQQGGWPQA